MVTRGTQTAALRMTADMREAIRTGHKSQARVIVGEKNSKVDRAAFYEVDLDSAHSIKGGLFCLHLSARANLTNGDRRTVTVTPAIQPAHILWPRVDTASRMTDPLTLWVKEVRAQRVNDISEEDAKLEGVLVHAADSQPDELVADSAYRELLNRLGARHRKAWCQTDLHATVLSRGADTRYCFALWWDSVHGAGSWRLNPWVWVYRFQSFPYDLKATVEFARSGALHRMQDAIERERAAQS